MNRDSQSGFFSHFTFFIISSVWFLVISLRRIGVDLFLTLGGRRTNNENKFKCMVFSYFLFISWWFTNFKTKWFIIQCKIFQIKLSPCKYIWNISEYSHSSSCINLFVIFSCCETRHDLFSWESLGCVVFPSSRLHHFSWDIISQLWLRLFFIFNTLHSSVEFFFLDAMR